MFKKKSLLFLCGEVFILGILLTGMIILLKEKQEYHQKTDDYYGFQIENLFVIDNFVYYLTRDGKLRCATPGHEDKFIDISNMTEDLSGGGMIVVYDGRLYTTIGMNIYFYDFEKEALVLFYKGTEDFFEKTGHLTIVSITDRHMVVEFLSAGNHSYFVLDKESLKLEKIKENLSNCYSRFLVEADNILYFLVEKEGNKFLYSYELNSQEWNMQVSLGDDSMLEILTAQMIEKQLVYITVSGSKNDLWSISLEEGGDMDPRHIDCPENGKPDNLYWDGKHLFVSLFYSLEEKTEIYVMDKTTLNFSVVSNSRVDGLRTWEMASDGKYVYWYYDKIQKALITD